MVPPSHRAILDAAPEGIVAVDEAGRVAFVNARAEAMFGYAHDELLGQPVDVFILDRAAEGRAMRGEDASRAASLAKPGLWGRRRDGSEFPIEVSLGSGSPSGGAILIASVRDATATKELERTRAERSAVVAHDLRAPLNVIALSSQLLLAGVESATERLAIARSILTSSQQMSRMIADLMELYRLEAASGALSREPVDIVEIARASVQASALDAKDRRIELRASAGAPRILGDPAGLGRVLGTLLGNAVQYGLEGAPIVVEVATSGDAVTVAVTNQGDWIPAEELPRMFQPFDRTGHAKSSLARGLSLGLHVARELVEAHGGSLEVESSPGATTTFRLTLPLG